MGTWLPCQPTSLVPALLDFPTEWHSRALQEPFLNAQDCRNSRSSVAMFTSFYSFLIGTTPYSASIDVTKTLGKHTLLFLPTLAPEIVILGSEPSAQDEKKL